MTTIARDRAQSARARDRIGSARARDRIVCAAIFVLAFALRFAFVLEYQSAHPNAGHLVIDEASYDAWARRIAGGDWIGTEVFFQEPLYPYFLGVLYRCFGADPFVARAAQCVLGAATCLLAGAIARRAFGRGAAFVAAASLAVYEPLLQFPCLLLKENLFLPLFAALVLVLLRARRIGATADRTASLSTWTCAGILAGLGALLRGNVLVLLPVLAIAPWWSRGTSGKSGKLARSACIALGALLVLLPVAVRNRAVGGVFALSTSGAGTNFYGGNNRENPYGRATEFSFVRGVPQHEAGDWRREAERRTGRALDPGEVSAYWRSEVFRSVRADPLLHLSICWNKLRLTLGEYEVPDNHSLAWDARYVRLARLPFPSFGALGVLGIAGLVMVLAGRVLPRRAPDITADPGAADRRASDASAADAAAVDPDAALAIAAVFFLYLATIVLTVTSERARLPLVPLLAAFAGGAVVAFARAARARDTRTLAWLTAATIFAAVIVHAPVISAAERADDLDEREYNLAVQRRDEPGRIDDARTIAAALVERHPRSARSRLLLAEIDFRRALASPSEGRGSSEGRADLARTLDQVERLLAVDELKARDRFAAHSLAAWILSELGRPRDAVPHFDAALAFDGDNRDLLRGRARAVTADAGEGAGERERMETAERTLVDLRASETDASTARELELDLARAEYRLATAILEVPRDVADRDAGRARIQRALDRMEAIVKDPAASRADVRRARILSGWIQHYLKNDRSAENHFRKALELGRDLEAELGLAYALYNRAVSEKDDPARPGRVAELRALIGEMRAAEPDDARVTELAVRESRLE